MNPADRDPRQDRGARRTHFREHGPGGPETGIPDEVKPMLQLLAVAMILGAAGSVLFFELREHGYHVFPGDDFQKVVNRAATNAQVKTVLVYEGVYNPPDPPAGAGLSQRQPQRRPPDRDRSPHYPHRPATAR